MPKKVGILHCNTVKNADLSPLNVLALEWEVQYRGKTVNSGLTFAAAYQLAEDLVRTHRSHRLNEGHGKCYALVVSSSIPLFSVDARIYVEVLLNNNNLFTSLSIL